ncbi:PREDICTED: sterile alpha motif domain-containing protein 11 [Myotis davidii]|uniref:sterile alpha motif domain-containing protein 11 n=1 Tax=Myotis davidii TaxID=225400 RepID=UPI000767C6AA|nr:PREDICTED: sterile alpha motif domain-containing protein 11 [Myotis davidii]
MSKGILQVHPPICDCPGCRISSPVNRGRLADKRTVALPPARVLKKELTSSFIASDGDSDGSGPACGQRPGLKQEDDTHIRIMKRRVHTHWDVNISFRETSCSQESDLPTLLSSLHRGGRLVMPERQSRCDFQSSSVEIGLGGPGDLLGKRLGRSPHIGTDCPSEKKARSKSPQETLLLSELGPSMAPEDHYRRLMSALSEAGTFEDPQRLYHLGLPSHGECPLPSVHLPVLDLLRVRQEVAAAAAAVRSPSGLEVHLPTSTGQRRKQGLAQHREGSAPAGTPSFSERYWVSVSEAPIFTVLVAGVETRHLVCAGQGSSLHLPTCQPPVSPASARPSEPKTTWAELWVQDGSEDEPPKDSDGEDPEMLAFGGQGLTPGGGASSERKGLLSGSLPPSLPLSVPCVSPYFHTGAMGGLFSDGEEATAPEDISKWTVDDVCSFVGGLSGCGEYTRVFREQGIDGETLPLLTEEHLLTTMGLKLGPALKIRAQVAKRLGRVFYVASFPVALPLQPPALRAPERALTSGEQPPSPATAPSPFGGGHPTAGQASPKQENGTVALLPGPSDPSQPLC